MGEEAVPSHRGQAGTTGAKVDPHPASGLAMAKGVP